MIFTTSVVIFEKERLTDNISSIDDEEDSTPPSSPPPVAGRRKFDDEEDDEVNLTIVACDIYPN